MIFQLQYLSIYLSIYLCIYLSFYAPRTVAGVFDFDTGLRLVKFRGEAMQQAAEVRRALKVTR